MLPAGWDKLERHPTQLAYWSSERRFNVVVAGRRSGKSVLARRRVVKKAMRFHAHPDGKFVVTAPTRDQVKRLHWEKLKQLVPPSYVVRWYDGELMVRLVNGAGIWLVGLDKHERAEGEAIDHCLMDEFGDTKPEAFPLSIRPSLSTKDRIGSCDFIGKPRGRNHLFALWEKAVDLPDWGRFHWKSSEIVDPAEVEAARTSMDDLQFRQEYEAEFVNFTGLAYYSFDRRVHASEPIPYDPSEPIGLCFDFNVEPGIAIVTQVFTHPVHGRSLGCIGEVWIEKDSNTLRVCDRLLQDWHAHRGLVYLYGDASGGARHTSQTQGSDWTLIEQRLRPVFGGRLVSRVPHKNPGERDRVNAVNTMLMSADKTRVRLYVHPTRCPYLVVDFEGTTALADGSINKRGDKMRTHMTDALGYQVILENDVYAHELVDFLV